MKRFILLFIAFMPYLVFAQKAKIEFENTSHNFGTVSENGGQVVYTFVYKNTGTTPLILTNVRAGCGCTTPEWNRQPTAPGAQGSIKVSFDPRNRPRSFIKSITVNSNAENSVLSLTIRGNVTRKPAGPYDAYKFSAGAIKMNENGMNLGTIKHTDQIEKSITIINSEKAPATITFGQLPAYLTINVNPVTIDKDQTATITLKYNATKRNDWGFVTDEVMMKVNNKEVAKLGITGTITEDFSAYQGDFQQAPVIEFVENPSATKEFAKNTVQTYEFHIQNNGLSDLIIRKIKPSDKETSVNVAKHTIKPGKKVKATAQFKTGNTPKVLKIIQFTTNDPKNPTVNYKINGNIK